MTSSGERLVLAALRGRAAVSRAELARLTGLPKTTLNGVVGRLLSRGVLVERATGASGRAGRGRPAAEVALAGPAGAVGVLALSHMAVRAAVVGFDGTVYARREAPLPPAGEDMLEAALRLLAAARAATPASHGGLGEASRPTGAGRGLGGQATGPAHHTGGRTGGEASDLADHTGGITGGQASELAGDVGGLRRRAGGPGADGRGGSGEAGGLACAVVGVPAPFEPGVGVVTGPLPEEVRATVPVLPDIFRCVPTDPAPVVADRLGVPTLADNDAHLGALGEATFGAGRGLKHIVYLKLVEGLGTGLILDGKLHRGARNLAGELAHVQVRDDGPWCACGGRGCLAQSFGGFVTGFLDEAYPRPISFADVLRLSAAGEAGTRRILHDVGRRVGRVLADVCVLLNPEAIVVDGMLGAAAGPVLDGIREMVDRHAMSPVARAVRVVAGDLGDRAELLGAVALSRMALSRMALGGMAPDGTALGGTALDTRGGLTPPA